jgi:hypothetical protein
MSDREDESKRKAKEDEMKDWKKPKLSMTKVEGVDKKKS